MGLNTIYIVRHGFRSNWTVNNSTGTYHAHVLGPTGIPSDPALAGHGLKQAEELADKLVSIEPPVDIIYSSPYYRCLQTLKPTTERLFSQGKAGKTVKVENGLSDFFGLATFTHPSPASLEELHHHFPSMLDPRYVPVLVPHVKGESIESLHDRIAYTLHRIINACDNDPSSPNTLLICTHAASMICMGRILTGQMPDDPCQEDFQCFTCALSIFKRHSSSVDSPAEIRSWDASTPDDIPKAEWRGKGLLGGWECTANGDCSFLSGGAERGWRFSGDESFLDDPNAFNDAVNEKVKGLAGLADSKGSRL